ncbi:hypothetical protein GW796_10660 [archaeon]|nr:hypothetical protein [archaeon]NCQ52323.1 hypothetical protein [archaeon]
MKRTEFFSICNTATDNGILKFDIDILDYNDFPTINNNIHKYLLSLFTCLNISDVNQTNILKSIKIDKNYDSYFEEDNPESTICRYNCKLNLHELYDHMIILSDLNINETVIYRIENDKKMDYILVDLRHLILILTSNLLLQKIN